MSQTSVAGSSNKNAPASVRTPYELNQELSQIINALRFPMAVGVVFIHNNWVAKGIQENVENGTWPILGFFKALLPTFFGMAVPLFFFISGFLFFRSTPKWSWQRYGTKFNRRIHSLLIPYLIWNVFSIFGEAQNLYRLGISVNEYFGEYSAFGVLRLFWCSGTYASTSVNWLGFSHLTDYPANISLWFVRDLIVLVLLAPIIYAVLKKLRQWFFLLVIPIYLFDLCPFSFPGFSISSLLFFSLGSFCSLEEIDFVKKAVASMKWSISIGVITLCMIILSDQLRGIPKELITRLYVLAAVSASIAIATCLLRRGLMDRCLHLASSSFFVFASHFVSYIGFLGISRFTLLFIFGEPETEWLALILFFVCPILAVTLSVFCYKFMSRFMPRTTAVLCGGR